MKNMKLLAASLALFGGLLFATALPPSAYAKSAAQSGATPGTSTFKDQACSGLQEIDATGCGKSADTSLTNIIKIVVNILTAIVGVVAVIFIIVGGFKYITSSGDTNAIATAKNTIIYAIVGLVLVALAQVIVRFVLESANNATTKTTKTSAIHSSISIDSRDYAARISGIDA